MLLHQISRPKRFRRQTIHSVPPHGDGNSAIDQLVIVNGVDVTVHARPPADLSCSITKAVARLSEFRGSTGIRSCHRPRHERLPLRPSRDARKRCLRWDRAQRCSINWYTAHLYSHHCSSPTWRSWPRSDCGNCCNQGPTWKARLPPPRPKRETISAHHAHEGPS